MSRQASQHGDLVFDVLRYATRLLADGDESGLLEMGFTSGQIREIEALTLRSLQRVGQLGAHFMDFRIDAVAIAINAGAPFLRRMILRDVLDLVCGPDQGNRDISRIEFDLGELAGLYVCSRSFEVEVKVSDEEIKVLGRSRAHTLFQIQGAIDKNGHIVFSPTDLALEPTFFADPDTHVPCLMLGVRALRKIRDLPTRVSLNT